MLRLLARRGRKEVGGWSPFARNDGDCDAVAQALLTALDHEDCALDQLTPTRYAELRRQAPAHRPAAHDDGHRGLRQLDTARSRPPSAAPRRSPAAPPSPRAARRIPPRPMRAERGPKRPSLIAMTSCVLVALEHDRLDDRLEPLRVGDADDPGAREERALADLLAAVLERRRRSRRAQRPAPSERPPPGRRRRPARRRRRRERPRRRRRSVRDRCNLYTFTDYTYLFSHEFSAREEK